MDRLSEMEAFVSVVDQGGFTDAAGRLGISKSAVSKHVSALEQRLGVRLLNRTTRRVSPTEIGLTYYDRARRVLTDAAAADELVTAMQSTPRGVLNISAPLTFGLMHLKDAVNAFLHAYPDVSVNLSLDDQVIDVVADGYDLAIRVGVLLDSSLMSRKLGETQVLMVASPAYLEKHGTPERVGDLSEHKLLHYSMNTHGNVWRLQGKNGEERHIRVGGQLAANNGEMLMEAAKSGLGIGLLPDFIVGPALASGDLVSILDDQPQSEIGIFAVYPPGRYMQPKTRAFIDHLVDHFKGRDFRT